MASKILDVLYSNPHFFLQFPFHRLLKAFARFHEPCEDAAFVRLLDAARETEQAVTDYLSRTRLKAD